MRELMNSLSKIGREEWEGLLVAAPVDIGHRAGLEKCGVESESCGEIVGCLASLAELEIVAQERAVDGVGAIVDDAVGALHRVEAAEIGHTLLGDEHIYRVFLVVYVAHHGYDVAYQTLLGDRGA